MALLALLVGVFSLRFLAAPFGRWPGLDPAIRQAIASIPWLAITHMVLAPIALLAGPLQLNAGWRARHRQAHRIMGRIYVLCCLAGGIGALVMAFHASGGVVAGWGFGVLALCWMGTTVGAWRAAVQRRIERHQLLMRFSYAMTFAAVTLRLQMPIGFALGFSSYSAMSVWLAYTSWLPNVAAVAVYSLLTRARRHPHGHGQPLTRTQSGFGAAPPAPATHRGLPQG